MLSGPEVCRDKGRVCCVRHAHSEPPGRARKCHTSCLYRSCKADIRLSLPLPVHNGDDNNGLSCYSGRQRNSQPLADSRGCVGERAGGWSIPHVALASPVTMISLRVAKLASCRALFDGRGWRGAYVGCCVELPHVFLILHVRMVCCIPRDSALHHVAVPVWEKLQSVVTFP
jgi:hypothetical protein